MLNLNILFQLLKRLSFDKFVCFLQTNITILKYIKFAKLIRKYANLIRYNVLNNLKTSTQVLIALNS